MPTITERMDLISELEAEASNLRFCAELMMEGDKPTEADHFLDLARSLTAMSAELLEHVPPVVL